MEESQAGGEEAEDKNLNNNNNPHTDLINTFCALTSTSRDEALFFLKGHNFSLDSALCTFLEPSATAAAAAADLPLLPPSPSVSPPPSLRSQQPTRSSLRSRQPNKKPSGSRSGGIRPFSDLNRQSSAGSGSDSDYAPQEYFTGGEG